MVSLRAYLRRLYARINTEHDFLLPYELLLVLPGFQLAARWHGGRARIFFVVMRALLLFQYFVWADRVYLALVSESADFDKAMNIIYTFSALSMMVGRMLIVRWFRVDVDRMKSYIRQQRAVAPTESSAYRKIVWIAIAFEMTGLANLAVFVFSSSYRRQLYVVPANVATLGWPAALLVHVGTFDLVLRWVTAINGLLTGTNTIMLGLADELTGIAREYQQLLPSRSDVEFWQKLENNIRHTMRRHGQFLLQVDCLKPFLRNSFLLMFYSAVLFIAMGMFQIGGNGTTLYDIMLCGFLVAVLLECYWCCRLVDKLNEESERIGHLIYGLDWPEQLRYSPADASRYRQTRTALLIMMSKTQKDLDITCGGFFAMSSEAFANLVKLTYTMLMFLLDTKHRS